MKKLEWLFFGLTRALVLVGLIASCVLIVVFALHSNDKPSIPLVTLNDLTTTEQKANSENAVDADGQPVSTLPKEEGYKLPKGFKDFLFDKNVPVEARAKNASDINTLMEAVPYEQRQQVIDNLRVVINQNIDIQRKKYTESQLKTPDVNAAIANSTYSIYQQYLSSELTKIQEYNQEKYERMGKQYAQYAAIGGLAFLALVMILILVLLSIERNTRKG